MPMAAPGDMEKAMPKKAPSNAIMTPGLQQLTMTLNSLEMPTSPTYFKNIEGFYYAYLDPTSCYERFGWEAGDFEFALKPEEELDELCKGLHIPQYGDVNFERKTITTKKGTMMDPVDMYI
jgi:hypothetical protein